jgi:hypothetical protein
MCLDNFRQTDTTSPVCFHEEPHKEYAVICSLEAVTNEQRKQSILNLFFVCRLLGSSAGLHFCILTIANVATVVYLIMKLCTESGYLLYK